MGWIRPPGPLSDRTDKRGVTRYLVLRRGHTSADDECLLRPGPRPLRSHALAAGLLQGIAARPLSGSCARSAPAASGRERLGSASASGRDGIGYCTPAYHWSITDAAAAAAAAAIAAATTAAAVKKPWWMGAVGGLAGCTSKAPRKASFGTGRIIPAQMCPSGGARWPLSGFEETYHIPAAPPTHPGARRR